MEKLYKQQLDENRAKQQEIKDLLLNYPKGHVNILYRSAKGYYYRTYREGKKVNNEYLGPVVSTDLSELFATMTERDRLKSRLRSLKEEERKIRQEARG